MIRLNHIGIAANQVPALTKLFGILGLTINHTEAVPDQGVVTYFLPLQPDASGAHLEFLEVTDPEAAVAQFIKKRGPGIHHLSFTVSPGELEPLSAQLKAAGYRMIYDQPRSGAHQMKINFIHPSSAGGMLIELMEPQGLRKKEA